MQSAELIGLNEVELRGFLNAIPNLWNGSTRFLETGIDLIMSNFIDSERLLTCTHLFFSNNFFIILFTEYLKEVGAATFKIYAYMPWFAGFSSNERLEARLMKLILDYSDKDMSSFRELAFLKIFICPLCSAQYSYRSLKMREDGFVQCQNCGIFVSVKKTESDLEDPFRVEEDLSED